MLPSRVVPICAAYRAPDVPVYDGPVAIQLAVLITESGDGPGSGQCVLAVSGDILMAAHMPARQRARATCSAAS